MTSESCAQTENRETSCTQTSPEKEYEDIMMLKPIGRGLHNLEPDQQTFMRPTTPSSFARPGYMTLDSHMTGYAGASISKSRSMQGIAGFPTMMRSPSVPINDQLAQTSPYCRQPLGAILPNNNQECGTAGQVSLQSAQGQATSRVVREQESEQTTTMHKEFHDGPYIQRQTETTTGAIANPQQYFAIQGSDQPFVTTPGSTMPRPRLRDQESVNESEHQYSSVQRLAGSSGENQQVQTSSISINHPIHVDIYSGSAQKVDQQSRQVESEQTSVPAPTPKFPTAGGISTGSNQGTLPRNVNESSKQWYRANISRDEAISLLKHRPAGTFLIRDSNTFKGAYGLAIKVNQLPPNVQPKPGADPEAELVRHFLIERTAGGVRLKGCANEPVFPSLAALVYQHSITPLALPCALLLPEPQSQNGTLERNENKRDQAVEGSKSLLEIGAACNVVYLGTVDCESLSGPRALGLAVTQLLRQTQPESRSTQVHFKVNQSGVTLTDNIRRLFFRRHYPPQSVLFCGLDPEDRKFTSANKQQSNDRIFGFVARRQPGQSTADNQCHVFAELDPSQPGQAVVDFINTHLLPMAGSS